jgi:hypothetical protein
LASLPCQFRDRLAVNQIAVLTATDLLPVQVFSKDRALPKRISSWTIFFIINRINQDQLVVVSSLRTDKPGFFLCVKVSSQITGNEVLISYRKSDINGLD